ncbi:hypothetical protein ON010_g11951 [Phytophthora cinnamomi]|nr:hypothetical protein ON010_g11951 [Phytophthora cinnamomi]
MDSSLRSSSWYFCVMFTSWMITTLRTQRQASASVRSAAAAAAAAAAASASAPGHARHAAPCKLPQFGNLTPMEAEEEEREVATASAALFGGAEVDAGIDALQDGEIVLLENVRFYKQETKNDPEFAKQLAHGADIYVNDAFGTAHRAHASTEGVTKYIDTNVAGFLIEKELKYLSGAVDAPVRPLGAIIGGAKVSTKIPVLKSLLQKCDKIMIGGGMIFTFYKAQGLDVGKSIIEEDKVELAKEILEEAKQRGVQIVLPTDVVVADKFEADAQSKVVPASAIPADWLGLDIGPDSQATFAKELKECKTVVWNGPMGVFEFPEFAKGTFGVAKALAESTGSGVTTIVGGGDSVAAVEQAGLGSKMSHISTGGGASLELLEGKVLPGVAALNDA